MDYVTRYPDSSATWPPIPLLQNLAAEAMDSLVASSCMPTLGYNANLLPKHAEKSTGISIRVWRIRDLEPSETDERYQVDRRDGFRDKKTVVMNDRDL